MMSSRRSRAAEVPASRRSPAPAPPPAFEGRCSGAGAVPPPPPAPASAATSVVSETALPKPTRRDADGVEDGRPLEEKSADYHQLEAGLAGGTDTADETKVSSEGSGGSEQVTPRLADLCAGDFPDPAHIKLHPTSFWIKLSALLNVAAGAAYIWWRATRSIPEDPVSPVWNWLFFAGECILAVGVWTSHLQRCFPAIRDVCTMDDLVKIDPNVASEANVCIMVHSAGEEMKVLIQVLLGAYSQRLWPSPVPASRQLRIAVLDEKGRRKLRDLVERVYQLAEVLVIPAVQLAICIKFDEPYITPKIFMEYFSQMDDRDRFVFPPETHPAFDLATRINKYARDSRGSRPSDVPQGRLAEGYKKLLNSSPNIPSIIYSARANPGTPKVSPEAGNMNAAIFPNFPRGEPVIGSGARIVVVNDARHRLKLEFLQRTVPYFFKLDRRSGRKYGWADVGFVQTPQRFHDGEAPLKNHAVCTSFVTNVSKDGVGGVISHGQGSLWRIDALRGMAADGSHTVDSVASPDMIGHDCGFRAEVRVEAAHTSLEFFKLQWRSAYVCEDGENLAVCVKQLNTLAWRVEQLFRWHLGMVQLLLKGGVRVGLTSKMPTPLHKWFGLESLTCFIQAVGGLLLILMPIMFSIFQEAPFDTVDLEFVYFFFPYVITAAIPTILALGWKDLSFKQLLGCWKFWLSTRYVPIWAFALGIYNRMTCGNPENMWNLRCPEWPMGVIFCLLIMNIIITWIYWMFYLACHQDGYWFLVALCSTYFIAIYSMWPMASLWWPRWCQYDNVPHWLHMIIVLSLFAFTSVLELFPIC